MSSRIDVDASLFAWMQDIRRQLHRYPELGFREKRTAALIEAKLAERGLACRTGWGKTGVTATLSKGVSTAHVALRADMDGLPITEANNTSYSSAVPGIMHACGHDGHVAMLLGAAALLAKCDFNGNITCIFQPAEEHGNGAQRLIEEGVLEQGIRAIFAGHIDVHFPTGCITVDEGVICSFSDPFTISIQGRGGHAARPHEAKDSIVAGAHLVGALQTLVSRETDPNHAAVLTIGRFCGGDANNVIAGETIIEGTLRSNDATARLRLLAGLARMVEALADLFEVKTSMTMHEGLPAVINSASGARYAREAARMVVAEEKVVSQGRPSLGGEDFAFYLQHVDGCLVRFGADSLAADSPAHSTTFDFDENVLAVGASWLAQVALHWLARQHMRGDDGRQPNR
jgi:amidohydrolase